jgi:hypothetical protein
MFDRLGVTERCWRVDRPQGGLMIDRSMPA